MPFLLRIVTFVGIALLLGTAISVRAEQAPVYDADSMSSFDDDGGELPSNQEKTLVPDQAQSAESSPMSLGHRVARMEQQISNLQSNHAASHIESLQAEVQSLRGQLEQVAHQVQQLQGQQKAMVADVDKRLAEQNVLMNKQKIMEANHTVDNPSTAMLAIKSARKVATDSSVSIKKTDMLSQASPNDQPNVAEEQRIYQTAYDLIKAKKYDDAVNALQSMLRKYPSGSFAANAHYWLGELYALMSKNDQALIEFGTVVKNYLDSPRVSDAQLKIAIIYAAQLKWSEAKAHFKKVINHYPGTAAARVASTQLKQLKQAGH